jgi:hypothetical protein
LTCANLLRDALSHTQRKQEDAVMPPTKHPVPPPSELTALELERVLLMPEAERITGLSHDTLKRNFPDKIIQLSRRRIGMKVKHAISLRMPAA